MIRVSHSSNYNSQFTSQLKDGPDLTGLIDIVFIVVVFLLLTANTSLLSLPVEVPETDSAIETLSVEQKPLLISIKASAPHWSLASANRKEEEQQNYDSWASFESALLSHTTQENTRLLIATDKDANAALLLKLLAFLNANALSNTEILMETE